MDNNNYHNSDVPTRISVTDNSDNNSIALYKLYSRVISMEFIELQLICSGLRWLFMESKFSCIDKYGLLILFAFIARKTYTIRIIA